MAVAVVVVIVIGAVVVVVAVVVVTVVVIVVIVLGHFCTDAAMARGLGAVGNTDANKIFSVYFLD